MATPTDLPKRTMAELRKDVCIMLNKTPQPLASDFLIPAVLENTPEATPIHVNLAIASMLATGDLRSRRCPDATNLREYWLADEETRLIFLPDLQIPN